MKIISLIFSLIFIEILQISPLMSKDIKEKCPVSELGITKTKSSDGDVTFHSTVFMRPISDEQSSRDDATKDAQLAARLQLRKEKDVPKTMSGKILGIVDTKTCDVEGRIYATVSVSKKTAEEAVEIANKMEKSLRDNPTPSQGSYSRIYDRDNK